MAGARPVVTTMTAAIAAGLAVLTGCSDLTTSAPATVSTEPPTSSTTSSSSTTPTTASSVLTAPTTSVGGPVTSITASTTRASSTTPTTSTTPGEETAVVADPVGFGAAATGGDEGGTVVVTSADALAAAGAGEEPLVIQIEGTVQLDGMVSIGSNKTVEGVGGTAQLVGGGLSIREAENVIVRNLTITGSVDDDLSIEASTNVLIDHNDLSAAADGALDITRGSDNITVSWNHFHDQDKNSLVGHSDVNAEEDTGRLRVTYHHNWFDGTNQRNPRVRFGNPVHVLNNYYSDIGSYGVASTTEAGVLVEANYFENVEDPFHLGEGVSPAGSLAAVDNHLVSSGEGQTGGTVAPIPYSYTPDPAESVKDTVTATAGVQS